VNTATGKEVDMDKKISLPKSQFIDDTDEGQGLLPTDQDVEGHVVIGRNQPEDFTVLTPPPGVGLNRSPGHGGELRDSGDDDR
jgi:hypothetical protein